MEIYFELFFIIIVGFYFIAKALLSLSNDIESKTSSEKALKALAEEVYLESIRLVRADWFEGEKEYSRQGGYTQRRGLELKSLNPTEGWDNFEFQKEKDFKDLDKVIFLTFIGATKSNRGEEKRIRKAVKTAFPDYKIKVVGNRFFEEKGHIYY